VPDRISQYEYLGVTQAGSRSRKASQPVASAAAAHFYQEWSSKCDLEIWYWLSMRKKGLVSELCGYGNPSQSERLKPQSRGLRMNSARGSGFEKSSGLLICGPLSGKVAIVTGRSEAPLSQLKRREKPANSASKVMVPRRRMRLAPARIDRRSRRFRGGPSSMRRSHPRARPRCCEQIV